MVTVDWRPPKRRFELKKKPFEGAGYFTTLSSLLRGGEVLRPPHFASNFGCFQVADEEIDFVDFLQIQADSFKSLLQVTA